ncbi:hypothetical protein B0H16DRAFT_1517892 [Mycena metata]|uniref:Uncharacterized protein n=1 Tax=Mycena metata TaxID=1033252 RepID=A0AAD7JQ57_9AGAR|nr:hypothetical protein B0H16DRAFT_1517892 [Mycena metata]
MSPPFSFILRYRLIYALSLVQVIVGVWTVWIYGVGEDVGAAVFQLTPTYYGMLTAAIMHRMLPYTLKTDPTHRFSRVDTHCTNLMCVVVFGFLSGMATFAACAKDPLAFAAPKWFPLEMNLIPLICIALTAFSAYRSLKRRAVELYGAELAEAPEVGGFMIALYETPQGSSEPKEAKVVPAWLVAQVADVMFMRKGSSLISK